MKKKILLFLVLIALGNTLFSNQYVLSASEVYQIENFEDVYPAGVYKVGVNLDAGEYRVYAEKETAFYAITSDSNGNEILRNSFLDDISYVNLNAGEYLELQRCFIVPVGKIVDEKDEIKFLKGGTYKVGIDIEAGEYYIEMVEGEDWGYWEITESSYGDRKILTNSFFENHTFVTLKEDQYIRLNNAFINLESQ